MSDDLTDYERTVIANVREHGWHCTIVPDPTGNAPPFAYSIGFARSLGCSEFIVFGLDQRLMHSMLWETFRQIKAGKPAEDNTRWSSLLVGFDCISRIVHPTNIVREYLNSAMWFWSDIEQQPGPLQAMQMVWPSSRTGKFPWEPNCEQDVRNLQPPLWLPNPGLH